MLIALYIFAVIYLLIAVIAFYSAWNLVGELVTRGLVPLEAVTPLNRFAGALIYGLLWPLFTFGPMIQRAFGVR